MEIKISVIIPVYNMEKYLQECLDTVLFQTMAEIEVICINDGSQDSSEEIIRKNMEKDSRIKLITQENHGVAYARNAGIRSASGEFVIFMDPDDWYPDDDVLECLYQKAKEEEVLICGGSFSELGRNGLKTEYSGKNKKFAFEEDGIVNYRDYQFDYGYHRFIYQLDFLRNNDIYFPLYPRYQDPPFFVKAMICAGKFYAMKKITYRYRVGHQNVNWTEKKLAGLLKGLRDNLKMSGEAGLKELHKITLERLGKQYLGMCAEILKETYPELMHLLFEINSYINWELISDDADIAEYAGVSEDIIRCALSLDSQPSDYKKDINVIEQLKDFITSRLDFRLSGVEEPILEVKELSDNKAIVSMPQWLQKDGVGYTIESYRGVMDILIQSPSGGDLTIWLRGRAVFDDDGNKVPYWIDFRNVKYNDEIVFEGTKSTWNEKPLQLEYRIEAGESIRLHVEWLPRRYDNEKIMVRLENYITGRLDFKLNEVENPDLEIKEVSDSDASILKPEWMQEDGVGYVIESQRGVVDILLQSASGGNVTSWLKGKAVPDSKGNKIPYWIDYKNIRFNEELLFEGTKSAWHDRPIPLSYQIKAGESVRFHAEWQPRMYDNEDAEVITHIKDYITARLDCKLCEVKNPALDLIAVSDNKAKTSQPEWLQKDAEGYTIESYRGSMDITFCAASGGKLVFSLRARDVRDKEGKRIPYWIDYKNVIYNDEVVFEEVKSAWHDKPVILERIAEKGERIRLHVEWEPHMYKS